MTLVEPTLENVSVGRKGRPGRPRKKPDRIIADKGYDSNNVRKTLDNLGIEPIIPKRENNKIATHQDGRKLRRYRNRWIVERTNSWIQNFRRLVVRYERDVDNFTGLLYLACALITLKRVMK